MMAGRSTTNRALLDLPACGRWAGSKRRLTRSESPTLACFSPSLKIGREFVKTQGHYHPAMPGTTIQYPEVYSHLFGEIYLLPCNDEMMTADRCRRLRASSTCAAGVL